MDYRKIVQFIGVFMFFQMLGLIVLAMVISVLEGVSVWHFFLNRGEELPHDITYIIAATWAFGVAWGIGVWEILPIDGGREPNHDRRGP